MKRLDDHKGFIMGEDTIPPWLWMTSIGLALFTILCFLIMLAGML